MTTVKLSYPKDPGDWEVLSFYQPVPLCKGRVRIHLDGHNFVVNVNGPAWIWGSKKRPAVMVVEDTAPMVRRGLSWTR